MNTNVIKLLYTPVIIGNKTHFILYNWRILWLLSTFNVIFRFQGNMRDGKTLGMTIYSKLLSDATGQKIYANYTLNPNYFKNYHKFEKWRDLIDVKNSIILFDEIGTTMDSRNYKSKDQWYFTHLFSQMGKLGNTMMYTTQREGQVEKRIREQTDYIIDCVKNWPNETIIYTWYDGRRVSNSFEATKIGTWTLEPQQFYQYYNSFEVVKSQIVIDNE